jgi:hypothetical protein
MAPRSEILLLLAILSMWAGPTDTGRASDMLRAGAKIWRVKCITERQVDIKNFFKQMCAFERGLAVQFQM